jgi:hypothetical protein
LRFFFHIGSVECVTCHVPESQLRAGREMAGVEEAEGREEGARRVMLVVLALSPLGVGAGAGGEVVSMMG